MEINYKNNKREGLEKVYNPLNGNLILEVNYINGKRDGLEMQYYENGNLEMEVTWVNGIAVSGYRYDIEGKKIKMTNAHLHNHMKDIGIK